MRRKRKVYYSIDTDANVWWFQSEKKWRAVNQGREVASYSNVRYSYTKKSAKRNAMSLLYVVPAGVAVYVRRHVIVRGKRNTLTFTLVRNEKAK